MAIFADFVRQAVVEHADRTAIVDPGSERTLSFREFGKVSAELEARIRETPISPGDRVGIRLNNGYAWVCAEAAAAAADLVTVPINTLLSEREVRWILDHAGATLLVTEPESRAASPSPPATDPVIVRRLSPPDAAGDAGLNGALPHRIMYTSATTGRPKGVVCPGPAAVGVVATALANQLRDVTHGDAFLAATPLTHMANSFFWSFFARGAVVVMQRKFTPASFCELVVRHEVTHTVLVPTMISMLLEYLREHPDTLAALRASRLRALWYAGSPVSPTVARLAEETLGPILNQQYGFTELFGAAPAVSVTALRAEDHARKPGSCGRAVAGIVVAVVNEELEPCSPGEVGEIVVRAHWPGRYWRLADSSEAYRGEWIHSGDLGTADEEGFVYITDRAKDVIISGGLNVYPREVEDVLVEHPGVAACAVVGVPHQKWGEVPAAAVVTVGSGEPSESELIEFAGERLASFKVPKRVRFTDSLPLSAIGKVLKRDLRNWLLEDDHSAPETAAGRAMNEQ